MTNRKVQLYINSDADSKLSQFLDTIEAEAPEKKGYLGNQIKEILRAWSGLVELYGEKDVLHLSMKLAARRPTQIKETVNDVLEEITDDSNISKNNLLKGFGSQIARRRNIRGE